MESLPWFWIWVVAAALLFVGEMLSLSFFLLPFAVGAVLAALACALSLDWVWQMIVFVIASVVALIALRPLARRLTRAGSPVKVGAERLVGMQGKVVEGKSAGGEFRVLVDRELWNASTEDGAWLELETAVTVLAINSNSLVVRQQERE